MSDLITITNCKNCGQKVETFNFCPDCGAKKITKRITFKSLMADFADRFLNLDNSFTRTFVHLFSKPEVVIEGYINGLRKRYINAFSYFAISITVTGFYGFLVKDRFIELSKIDKFSNLNSGFGSSLMDFSFQYQSAISFLSIPLLALLCRLVFLNYKKFNLTEHFVIYLYAYSHIVGTASIISFPIVFMMDNFWILSVIQLSIYAFYIAFVLKRLYTLSLRSIILKTLLFLVLGGFLYILFGIIIVIIIFLTGNFSPADFQPRS